ncbi:hypothetical protein FRB93_009142 [Tulasnella sp. JGI-2019a]|nr:hypothetical protein FRB93_009142 [Tulasnella sp. JGI-2019a]
MAVTVQDWKNRVLANEPGASDRCEAFKTERKAEVAKIMKNGDECLEWSRRRRIEEHMNRDSVRDQRLRIIIERLLRAGYERRDIDAITDLCWNPLVLQGIEVTNTHWKALSAHITQKLTGIKAGRVTKSRDGLHRREVATTVITQYRSNNGLKEDSLTPAIQELLSSPPFEDVIERGKKVRVTPQDVDVAVAGLPHWILNWERSKMAEILEIVADGGGLPLPDAPSGADFEILGLAKTIFGCRDTCSPDKNIHTLNHIGRHVNFHRQHPFHVPPEVFNWYFECLKYDADASRVVEELVITAGLDPNTATVDDLDELDARFYCQNCPEGAVLARNWRNCARHIDEHPLSAFVGWTLLSTVDTANIIALENTDPKSPKGRIKCAHADRLRGSSLTSLSAHLKHRHGIDSPGSHDYIIDPLIEPRPVALTGHPLVRSAPSGPKHLKCGHCGPRLFCLEGLKLHAEARHKPSSFSTTDYVDAKTTAAAVAPIPEGSNLNIEFKVPFSAMALDNYS